MDGGEVSSSENNFELRNERIGQEESASSETSEKDTNESQVDEVSGTSDNGSRGHEQTTRQVGAGSSGEEQTQTTQPSHGVPSSGNCESQESQTGSGQNAPSSDSNSGGTGARSAVVVVECSGTDTSIWDRSDEDQSRFLGTAIIIKNVNHRTTVPQFTEFLELQGPHHCARCTQGSPCALRSSRWSTSR